MPISRQGRRDFLRAAGVTIALPLLESQRSNGATAEPSSAKAKAAGLCWHLSWISSTGFLSGGGRIRI